MKVSLFKFTAFHTGVLAAAIIALPQFAQAHFPWLATDDAGHAVMWFGESLDDRTYAMPATIAAIKLSGGSDSSNIEIAPFDSDEMTGVRSVAPVERKGEIAGTVSYGLYHGSLLTYHVEHLPGSDPASWPAAPRKSKGLQTVILPTSDGAVSVQVLRNGKPLPGTSVKLFCDEGHEEADRTTDTAGIVVFNKTELESGLNAVQVSVTDGAAKGDFKGEPYSSTSDFLEATFFVKSEHDSHGNGHGKKGHGKHERRRPAPAEGKNSDGDSASTETANELTVQSTDLPELPVGLTSFGGAVLGDSLYLYGGHTGSAHSYSTEEQSGTLWRLDLANGPQGKWEKLNSGPRLQGLALVAWQDRLIRIGGFSALNNEGEEHDLQSQTSVASFDPATGQWSDLPSLPEPRSSLDAAVLGDTVYVFGGWALGGDQGERGDIDASHWHQSAVKLDLSDANASWQPLAEPPFQRRALSTAAYDGKLYVVGGMTPNDGPVTKVAIYDPVADQWQEGPALSGSGMSGFGSSAFACGGRLYVSTMDGVLHRLNQDGQCWTSVGKSDNERFFHRMLPWGEERLLMVGGANMSEGKFLGIDQILMTESP